MNCTVLHYDEIFLKGKNRIYFEKKLISNLKKISPKIKIKRYNDRLILYSFNEKIDKRLRFFPGIEYFAHGVECNLDIDTIKKECLNFIEAVETFKIKTKRSNKTYGLTSMEVNELVGEYIVKKKGLKVDLETPDVTIYIEICKKKIYIYNKKIKGIGGLPISVSGKLVSLISGDIDSPVASYFLMKRGAQVIFIHFLNESITTRGVEEKVEMLIKKLTDIQLYSKSYIVSFKDLQIEIIKYVPSKYRMIVYRRFMLKIANEIAKREGARGIITGDSLSQVASQTIENLNIIYGVSDLPVFTPLIGLNKKEIISIAKKIETYDISILPYQDCCSFMIAKHPEIKADLQKIEKLESRIDPAILQKIIENSKVKKFGTKNFLNRSKFNNC